MRVAFFPIGIYLFSIYLYIYLLSFGFLFSCCVTARFLVSQSLLWRFSIAFFVILISQLPYLCKSFEPPFLGFCYSCMLFRFSLVKCVFNVRGGRDIVESAMINGKDTTQCGVGTKLIEVEVERIWKAKSLKYFLDTESKFSFAWNHFNIYNSLLSASITRRYLISSRSAISKDEITTSPAVSQERPLQILSISYRSLLRAKKLLRRRCLTQSKNPNSKPDAFRPCPNVACTKLTTCVATNK